MENQSEYIRQNNTRQVEKKIEISMEMNEINIRLQVKDRRTQHTNL